MAIIAYAQKIIYDYMGKAQKFIDIILNRRRLEKTSDVRVLEKGGYRILEKEQV